jgi:hypothetical protein
MPLTPAYARTIHKFQGLSAGPVDHGKITNPYECIVCDPDKNQVEGRALGLLYTAVSRATTLGDPDGLRSAIYFTGKDFKEERIRMLGKKKDSYDDYENIYRRNNWVAHLKRHTTKCTLSQYQMEQTIEFFESKFTYDNLHNRITQYITAKTRRPTPSRNYKRKRQKI